MAASFLIAAATGVALNPAQLADVRSADSAFSDGKYRLIGQGDGYQYMVLCSDPKAPILAIPDREIKSISLIQAQTGFFPDPWPTTLAAALSGRPLSFGADLSCS